MTTAKISSRLQDRISLYLKSAQSGNDKQKNGTEGFSQKFVRITQSPVDRKFSHLQGQRPPVEKHFSSFSHIPVSQNLSSPPSQNIELKQQNTSDKPAGSLADALALVKLKNSKTAVVSKGPADKNEENSLLQELKTKFAADKNKTDQATDDIPHNQLNWIQQEIAQLKEAYNRDEPNRVEAEAKVDAKIAEALANELAQQAGNKINTQAEPTQVKLQFDANGVPTSVPSLPPSSLLTPSRSIELKPQDKSKQQTSTLVKLPPEDLMQELKAKLAKTQDQNDDVSNRSPNKKQQKVRDEMAKGREAYKLEEPNRVAAETKADAKVAEAQANEVSPQAGNKTSTEAEQFKVDLKFDANGVPTPPPLPLF